MQQTQDRLALEPKLVAMKEKVREEQEGRAAEAVKIRPGDSELDERNSGDNSIIMIWFSANIVLNKVVLLREDELPEEERWTPLAKLSS